MSEKKIKQLGWLDFVALARSDYPTAAFVLF